MEIRAIYEKGVLKLIDPIDLEDGQQVKLMLMADSENDFEKRLADAGLLAEIPEDFEEVELSDEELDRLGKMLASDRPVEDLIDEDRGEY